MTPGDRDLEEWARDLPYPMAAGLWSYVAEQDQRARLDASIHFFEVSTRYLTTILLSGLRADRAAYLDARRSWQGNGPAPSSIMQRSTMGSWARFGADMSKALRRHLHTDAAVVAERFGLTSPLPLHRLASRETVELMAESVHRRNDWRGHDSAVTVAERRRRVDAMGGLIRDLRTALDGALDDWDLWQPRTLKVSGGSHVIDALLLDGPNPRLRSRPVILHHPIDTDRLYVSAVGSARALELVPLISLVQSEAAAEAAVYFFDRLDRDDARWLSYDAAGQPETRTPASPELLDLLADLDEAPEGPAPVRPAGQPKPAAVVRAWDPPKQPGFREDAGRSAADRRPLIARFLEALHATLPDVALRNDADRTSLVGRRRIGWVRQRRDTLQVVANVPIERIPAIPGSLVTELPVTEDDLAGVELLVEDASEIAGAVAALVMADAVTSGSDLDADRLPMALQALGIEAVSIGKGLWPPTDLSRTAQARIWDDLVTRLSGEGGIGDRSVARWPGVLRISWLDGMVVSVALSSVAVTIAVELSEPMTTRSLERLIGRRRELTDSTGTGYALQRSVTSLLVARALPPFPAAAVTDGDIAKLSDQSLELAASVVLALRD